jgi:hypothetical protein
MLKRRLMTTVAIAALVLTGSTVTASGPAAAQAQVAADSCVRGEACIFLNNGTLLYSNGGNTGHISVNVGFGGYVVNRGVRYPGLDHIQVTAIQHTPPHRYTICLHYGAGTDFYSIDPNAAGWGSGYIEGWRWRGECGANEDDWQYVGPA